MNPELENLVSAGRISPVIAEQLSTLEVGAYCNHKSWGAGKIANWDLLGGQIVIDFEDKPGHGMKLEFAAKSLDPLDPSHVLSRRLEDRETLAAEAVADPEAFVASLLKDFGGSMMLDNFEDVVKGKIIPEGKFKSWWEASKKKLRVNRRFVVPPKRTEPLELRQEDLSPGDAMVEDLVGARDLKAKSKASEAILNDFGAFEVPEVELVPVIEDVNETVSKAYKMNPGPVVDLILARDEMLSRSEALAGAVEPGVSLVEVIQQHKGDKLREMIGGLSVASLRKLLASLPEAFEDEWVDVALDEFNKSSTRGVSEIAKCIVAAGKQAEFEAFLRNGVRHRSLSADAVVWVCRERKGEAAALFDTELAPCIIQTLERDYYDEESVRHNRLHDLLLNDPDLLPDLMGLSDTNQAKTFTRRLMGSPVFEELNRRSLLMRIVKIHPHVSGLVGGDDDRGHKSVDKRLVVSWESLQEKQKALEKLVNVEIPANKKEIQIAREHGDLRENFEFKAAKQTQAVLMRLKTETEEEIQNARGTDFSEADPSRVSIGTRVTIVDDANGEAVTYTILGAWDTNLEKGIISYLSGIAEALMGKKVGESAQLSTEEEGVAKTVTIQSIEKFAS